MKRPRRFSYRTHSIDRAWCFESSNRRKHARATRLECIENVGLHLCSSCQISTPLPLQSSGNLLNLANLVLAGAELPGTTLSRQLESTEPCRTENMHLGSKPTEAKRELDSSHLAIVHRDGCRPILPDLYDAGSRVFEAPFLTRSSWLPRQRSHEFRPMSASVARSDGIFGLQRSTYAIVDLCGLLGEASRTSLSSVI